MRLRAQPPARLGVLVGDAVHNLRAALDHVVYELASANHGEGDLPAEVAEKLQFPVVYERTGRGGKTPGERFDTSARQKLAGCPRAVFDLIEAEQPYHKGSAYTDHPLWQLGQLDNYDKHRTLTVTAPALGVGTFVGVRGDVRPSVTFWHAGGAVEDGQALVTYSHADEGARAFFRREIRFAAPTPIDGSVEETLATLTSYVSNLVGTLATHL